MKFTLICMAAVALMIAAGGSSSKSDSNSSGQSPEKFSGNYAYNPPVNNYYVKTITRDKAGEVIETRVVARIDKGYTYGTEGDYYAHTNEETRTAYMRNPENGEWWGDPYGTDEIVEEENGIGLTTCDDYFMRFIRAFGIEEKLSNYYMGKEKILGVDCWVFESKGLNAIMMKFWVDPSNGCTLKYQHLESGEEEVVVAYDLNYTKWTDNLRPANYETVPWP